MGVVCSREGRLKTGILGGTFDPVHLGHLAIAEEARLSQGLSEVIMVPVGRPVIKPNEDVTPAEHRLSMLKLAIEGRTDLRVSDIEIMRLGPSYTVDTIAQLRKSSGADCNLYFIVGWDSLMQMPGWREPSRIIEMCKIISVPRPGYRRPDMKKLEGKIPGITAKTILLNRPLIDVSASTIRRMAAIGEPVERFVPAPVAEYIRKYNLYHR
jgi:nicotinate-nucleotide adenylyltransferase